MATKAGSKKRLTATKTHGGARRGAGRKTRAQELGLAQMMSDAWPDEQRRAVIAKLHAKALRGDVKAAQLLLNYAYGTPKQTVEHEGELFINVVKIPPKLTPEEWQEQLQKSE